MPTIVLRGISMQPPLAFLPASNSAAGLRSPPPERSFAAWRRAAFSLYARRIDLVTAACALKGNAAASPIASMVAAVFIGSPPGLKNKRFRAQAKRTPCATVPLSGIRAGFCLSVRPLQRMGSDGSGVGQGERRRAPLGQGAQG